jgi:hypothetical protein
MLKQKIKNIMLRMHAETMVKKIKSEDLPSMEA